MKEAIVEQQIKISNLEHQFPANFPDLPTVATPAKAARTQGQEVVNPDALMKEREECRGRLQEGPAEWVEGVARRQAKQEAGERGGREVRGQAEREAKERVEREARESQEQTERAVKEQAEEAARERAEREAKKRAADVARVRLAEVGAQLKAADEAKKWEEREEKERAERETKEKDPVSKIPSSWVRDHRGVWIQGETPSGWGWGSSVANYLLG